MAVLSACSALRARSRQLASYQSSHPAASCSWRSPYFRIASVDYLRAMLVAHGALPPRDEPLARLERAVADLLAQVPAGEDRRALAAYATWRVLHRARRCTRTRPTPITVTRHATLRLRAAIALLEWLRGNDIRLDQLRQPDIDQWLLTGSPTPRGEIGDFLGWTATRRLTPRLTVARAAHRGGAATSEDDYWRLAQTAI